MAVPGKVSGEVLETLIADQLTIHMAAVRRHLVLDVEEGQFPFANPPVMEFRNSPNGRKELAESKLPKNWIDGILLIWGDEPTEEDEKPPEEPDPHPPYEEDPDPDTPPEED